MLNIKNWECEDIELIKLDDSNIYNLKTIEINMDYYNEGQEPVKINFIVFDKMKGYLIT